ncbi:MAG: hypothetical protein QM778_02265 [Myxococcales bacterium]
MASRDRAGWLRALAGSGLLSCLLLIGPEATRAELPEALGAIRVDGLAAVVGGLAPGKGVISIYRSDVELRARLSMLRAGADPETALGPLPASLLSASLDELVGEALVASEAARLSLAKPGREQILGERQRFALGVGGEAQLQSFARALGVTDGELGRIVERKAVVSGFLAANLEGTLDLSPSEIEKAYAEQEHPFGDQPLEQVRDQLRAWLIQRRVQAAVGRWVESLRQRTPSKRLVTY